MQIPDYSPDSSSSAQDVLREEARVWLHRLTSGDVTEWDAQAFKRWQDTSPAHQQAFADVRRQWQLMQPVIGKLLQAKPDVARHHARTMSPPRLGRRAFIGGMTSVAAVTGVTLMHPGIRWWLSPDGWNADYQTAIGEQKTLDLAQTISVTLNTRTSMRHQSGQDQMTSMELLTGEAAVDIRQGGRAIGIQAGAGRSVTYDGRFEVRHTDEQVCVTCIQGEVQVYHPAGERTLRAAQQAVYDVTRISGVTPVDTAVVSAWRVGELVFRQTPLQQVLDEINRYRTGHVVLAKSSVKTARVSGRFFIRNLDAALLQLQHTFELHARSLPGGMLLLS